MSEKKLVDQLSSMLLVKERENDLNKRVILSLNAVLEKRDKIISELLQNRELRKDIDRLKQQITNSK